MILFKFLSLAFLIVLLLAAVQCPAQDTLVMRNGLQVYGKVIEIGESTLSYKKQSNPAGPTYTISSDSVFMIFYKNGRREAITPASREEATTADHPGPKNDARKIALEKNNYVVELTELKKIPDNKEEVYSASVVVYYKAKKLMELTVAAGQPLKTTGNYTQLDKRYCKTNYITAVISNPESLSKYLYEKYESYSGAGFGWAIPPHFFSAGTASCSVAFVQLKNDLIAMSGFKVSEKKMDACDTIEQRFLSFVLIWLNENFKA